MSNQQTAPLAQSHLKGRDKVKVPDGVLFDGKMLIMKSWNDPICISMT